MTKQLARYVHEGEVLRPIGDVRITLRIDPVALQRVFEAAELAARSFRGEAVKVQPWNRPDEQNIIDQE